MMFFRPLRNPNTRPFLRALFRVRTPLIMATTGLVSVYSYHHITQSTILNELQPDPRGDTYENGLYIASQSELENQHLTERNNKLKTSSFKIIHKIAFLIQDYIIEPFITVTRFFELAIIFLPVLIALPLSYPRSTSFIWYKILRISLENAGASFIKLGQWAASRTDIFSQQMIQELGNLHSNAKVHGMRYTRRVLEESFGLKLEELFEWFNEKPIGVGAIAQVYLAKLKTDALSNDRFKEFDNDEKIRKRRIWDVLRNDDETVSKTEELNGQVVAIKVMHPGVEKNISRDLKIMGFFAGAIDLIPTMEWLSFPDEVRNFDILMNLQLDLRIEGLNLKKFRELYQDDFFINFPKPYLSNRHVLIEEYIQGLSMESFLQLKNNKIDKDVSKRLSEKLIDSFLKMLILNNFIHSDLHPGNIIIRFIKTNDFETEILSSNAQRDSVSKVLSENSKNLDKLNSLVTKIHDEGFRPEICYIDAGLVTELNQSNRVNFIALFNSLAEFDGYKAGELMIERSKTPETAINPEIFALKTEKLVDKIKQRTFTLGTVSIGDLLEKMLTMVRSHHVRMEGDFISVIVAILLLEGLGRQLDPDMDLFASSLPILRRVGLKDGILMELDKVQMFKVWLTLELRQFISLSVNEIYRLVKSDELCPNY